MNQPLIRCPLCGRPLILSRPIPIEIGSRFDNKFSAECTHKHFSYNYNRGYVEYFIGAFGCIAGQDGETLQNLVGNSIARYIREETREAFDTFEAIFEPRI